MGRKFEIQKVAGIDEEFSAAGRRFIRKSQFEPCHAGDCPA